MEAQRVFLAGFLMVLVWVFWQAFFFSYSEEGVQGVSADTKDDFVQNQALLEGLFLEPSQSLENEVVLTINNGKFSAEISNARLGSFLQYRLSEPEKRYLGAYTLKNSEEGFYNPSAPVSFLFSKNEGFNVCSPCIEGFYPKNVTVRVNGVLQTESKDIFVDKKTEIDFVDPSTLAKHKITIFPNDFSVAHTYSFDDSSYKKVLWKNGTRPSEKYYWLDDQMSYAMFVGANESDYDWLTGNLETASIDYGADIAWVGTRNKFFMSILKPVSSVSKVSIVPKRDSFFAKKYTRFVEDSPPPASLYDIELYFEDQKDISFESFLAPLEYSIVSSSGINNLDWIMTLGASIFKPISVFILKLITWIKSSLPFGGGYASSLILFAIIVRIITGPLSKRSLESTKKMSEVQPLIKTIQEKHKNDPKKLQMEIMSVYKENKVNPLSGCLLMFLQWPIMIPPFIVFRSAVELRGESFLWLKDLSHPDYILTLPFNIPFLGFGAETGIGLLPILMGFTLFLTMKQTSSSLEGQNKVMLYSMNGMFVFLFNSFPAGLNLYYVVYNVLNYLQQKSKK
ncbi:MAG: hypothetical protein CMG00_05485 [Candidatus Marinimicrobia bacterium]|nr:hypothetical protein [Candidatus Neomarinimicrobiota bacterium]|tara:strand:+ start:33936 stop:35636 length:1701 start_codon:yes stop_codon:yes gene_type:complete